MESQVTKRTCNTTFGWFTVSIWYPSDVNVKSAKAGDEKARFIFVDPDKFGIIWYNVSFFLLSHIATAYTFYKLFTLGRVMWPSWLFLSVIGFFSTTGVTVGAHRLWSHKAYKGSLVWRVIMAIFFISAGHDSIFVWARNHRLHHKFTDTDADPYNSRRGVFFSHVGWLLQNKHPDIHIKGKTVDVSDLLADPVVYYSKKYYVILFNVIHFVIPFALFKMFFPNVLTDVEIIAAIFAQHVLQLHIIWFINSAAHMIGDRPYNCKIQPRDQTLIGIFGFHEGFHNFHHSFPWDYRLAEFGFPWYDPMRWMIEIGAKLGLTYDLRVASQDLIRKTKDKVQEQRQQLDETKFYVKDHPYLKPLAYA